MKFHLKEHRAIKAVIEKSGLPYESFTFTKKQGRLHVQYENQEPPFVFFRKRETALGDDLQWDIQTIYYLGTRHQQKAVGDWDAILKAFGKWLKALA